mmetsp:Transcript_37183/g.119543  ORF Transcript_37183/g.119543 Transcript_37183/m.119543 type:complete len:220 (+) Transcript_37183:1301-1960(+)
MQAARFSTSGDAARHQAARAALEGRGYPPARSIERRAHRSVRIDERERRPGCPRCRPQHRRPGTALRVGVSGIVSGPCDSNQRLLTHAGLPTGHDGGRPRHVLSRRIASGRIPSRRILSRCTRSRCSVSDFILTHRAPRRRYPAIRRVASVQRARVLSQRLPGLAVGIRAVGCLVRLERGEGRTPSGRGARARVIVWSQRRSRRCELRLLDEGLHARLH